MDERQAPTLGGQAVIVPFVGLGVRRLFLLLGTDMLAFGALQRTHAGGNETQAASRCPNAHLARAAGSGGSTTIISSGHRRPRAR